MIFFFLFWMLVFAVVPTVLFSINLQLYVPPPGTAGKELPAVSILIPARDEAAVIRGAVTNALETRAIEFEVVVMDDGSTDGTDAIVREIAAGDPRVRLEQAPPLPAGWNGKQHACWALAHAARNPVLCFVDADVTLGPDCVARMAQFLVQGNNGLVSGFPRQLTETGLEWLLLPLIHFVLLGFLPLSLMRKGTDPGFAAGCGQFIMARKDDYFACGGHSKIKLTMHDGLLLPRLFRAAGFRTDLADITNLASCRMYTTARQVWQGLAKNATEGLAAPARIVPITLMLLLGQVLPFFALLYLLPNLALALIFPGAASMDPSAAIVIAAVVVALVAAWLPRWLSVGRFKQEWQSAWLHPVGVLALLAVQWYSLGRKLLGGQVSWRGRAYAGE